MRLWQGLFGSGLFDREAPGPVAALQVLEPVYWDARRSSGKLKETGFLLGVPASDAL